MRVGANTRRRVRLDMTERQTERIKNSRITDPPKHAPPWAYPGQGPYYYDSLMQPLLRQQPQQQSQQQPQPQLQQPQQQQPGQDAPLTREETRNLIQESIRQGIALGLQQAT